MSRVTVKMNSAGEILLWRGDPINTNDDTAEVTLGGECATRFLSGAGEDVARELRAGWTCVDFEIPDALGWFEGNK